MLECLQIRENSVVIYSERLFSSCYSNQHKLRASVALARKTQYSGTMTTGARKRMARAITLMCQGSKPKWHFSKATGKWHYHHLSFITLTIASSKKLQGKWTYENLLKPFLRWMRETKGEGGEYYIWKLEFQKRGQIHYHITTPAFIDYTEVREKWNDLQREAGLLGEYVKEKGHYNAPSTEIRAVKKVKNMASYLTKELGKSVNANHVHAKKVVASLIKAGEIPADQEKAFVNEYTGEEMKTEGKIWGCSENFGGVPYFSTDLRSEVINMLNQYEDKKQVYCVKGDFFSIIFFNEDLPPPWHLLNDWEKKNFDTHIRSVFTKPQDIEDITREIPAELVPLADEDLEYTWEQMQLCFN
jgi:hypothetical protein